MGGSTRYPPFYNRQRDAKATPEIMGGSEPPVTLSDGELERGQVAITQAPRPLPVAAWVRYRPHPVIADAFTVRWTARAVEVFWLAHEKRTHVGGYVTASFVEDAVLAWLVERQQIARAAIDAWPRIPIPERRELLRGLIEHVVVTTGRPRLTFEVIPRRGEN